MPIPGFHTKPAHSGQVAGTPAGPGHSKTLVGGLPRAVSHGKPHPAPRNVSSSASNPIVCSQPENSHQNLISDQTALSPMPTNAVRKSLCNFCDYDRYPHHFLLSPASWDWHPTARCRYPINQRHTCLYRPDPVRAFHLKTTVSLICPTHVGSTPLWPSPFLRAADLAWRPESAELSGVPDRHRHFRFLLDSRPSSPPTEPQ
jgi:hypothetical protein